MLAADVEAMLSEDLARRVLAFDSAAAAPFADISANRRRTCRPISVPDAQIAAIARSRGASLATRNAADFEGCEVDIVNPWTAPA